MVDRQPPLVEDARAGPRRLEAASRRLTDARECGIWVHMRTTNWIESTFATVRSHTKVTKGPGSRAATIAMAFKLIEAAQTRWRAVNAPHLVALVGDSALFRNGKLLERPIDITAKKTAESHDTDVTETGSSTGFDNISRPHHKGPTDMSKPFRRNSQTYQKLRSQFRAQCNDNGRQDC